MALPRVISTPTDLVKHVRNVLGDQWQIAAGESTRVEIGRATGLQKHHYWHLSVECTKPLPIRVFLCESTFGKLVKATERELWERIREEFEKQSVKWQVPPDPDSIEHAKPRIARKPAALPNKQLALPNKQPAIANQPQGKQLLLLPPPDPDEHRCRWPGCQVEVDSKAWGCHRHWALLPLELKLVISDTFQPGNDRNKAAYHAAMQVVRSWIQKHHSGGGV